MKIILIALCAIWVCWSWLGLDRFIYKHLFSSAKTQMLSVWKQPAMADVEDTSLNQIFEINGYRIRKTLHKKFALSAVSVYRDDNTEFIKWYFDNSGNETGRAYNKIATFDLSLVHGKTASESNLKKVKFSHELNMLKAECKTNDCYYDYKEVGNFHVIPASRKIYYGLKSIPERSKVPVYVEGYLMDWSAVDFPNLNMKTALFYGQISKQKAGGQTTGLCFQLYLTRLIYDGYVFE